jgi:hypothetical protein
VRADDKLTAFMQLESAIRGATGWKSACYENLPAERQPSLTNDHDRPALWQGAFRGLASQLALQSSQPEQTETERRRANPASGAYLLVGIYPVNLVEPRDNRLKPGPSPSRLMLSIASVEPVSGACPKRFGKLIDESRTVLPPMIPV